MIFLCVLAAYPLLGVVGVFLTYHNHRSPFYGRVSFECIGMGLLTGPGCFLYEMFSMFAPDGITAETVLFKRKSK